MSTIQSLPNELLLDTFEHLDAGTLKSLCLVSRDMSRIAQGVMYRWATLDDRKEQPVKSLVTTLMERPDLAEKVRTLDLRLGQLWEFTDSEKIYDSGCLGPLEFVQNRLGNTKKWNYSIVNRNEEVWAAILIAHAPNLEMLSISRGRYPTDRYLQQFQQLLKELFEAGVENDAGSKVLLFPKLRRLKISNARLSWDWFEMAKLDELVFGHLDRPWSAYEDSPQPTLTSLSNNCLGGELFHPNYPDTPLFRDLLTTCRHLTNLRLDAVCGTPQRNGGPNLSWEHAIQSLAPLAARLETLEIKLWDLHKKQFMEWLEHTSPILSLKHFHRLRRLAAPLEAFTGKNLTSPSGLKDILPDSIETLTIYCPNATIFPY
jgi:hypothetical protein